MAKRPVFRFCLYKSVHQRSLKQLLNPLRFWLRIRGDIRYRKSIPRCGWYGESPSELQYFQETLRSPYLRCGKQSTLRIVERVGDSPYCWRSELQKVILINSENYCIKGLPTALKGQFVKTKSGMYFTIPYGFLKIWNEGKVRISLRLFISWGRFSITSISENLALKSKRF